MPTPRRPLLLIALALLTLLLTLPPAQAEQAGTTIFLPFVGHPRPYLPPDNRDFELEVLRLVNEQRLANGLGALPEDLALTQAARRHSRDMADHDWTKHEGTDGSTYESRIIEAGYPNIPWTENIAWSYSTPARTVDAWMHSPPHRASILSIEVADIGLAYSFAPAAQYRHAWVITFGKR